MEDLLNKIFLIVFGIPALGATLMYLGVWLFYPDPPKRDKEEFI